MTTAQSAVELSKINLLESARLNLEALLFHFRGQGHLLEKSFQAFQKEVVQTIFSIIFLLCPLIVHISAPIASYRTPPPL